MTYYPYYPRKVVSDIGVWTSRSGQFKIYGILADSQEITDDTMSNARRYLENDMPAIIESSDQSNHLGFVIIHPGDLGVSILVHWWVQGSVMCQHVRRWLPDADVPVDMSDRHVVGCVWELGLIGAEQVIWRKTMMGKSPDRQGYLDARPDLTEV
ncbi:MAG: hypothetical protein AAF402_09265 [Pseudomonadota bacterium]